MKILKNIFWLFFDRFFRLGSNLILFIWIARKFGPELFGTITLAIAVTEMANSLSRMGMQNIVVNELVNEEHSKDSIIANAAATMASAGLLSYLVTIAASYFIWGGLDYQFIIIALIATATIHRFSEVSNYYFESKTQSKHTVIAYNSVYVVFLIAKVALIAAGFGLQYLAVLMALEALATSIAAFLMLRRFDVSVKLRFFSLSVVSDLIGKSWPLVVSALAIMLYMRVDQMMLSKMLSIRSVGLYSAALQISQLLYFFPTMIVASVFPSLLEKKKTSEKHYLEDLQSLYCLLTAYGVASALFIVVASDFIIGRLYGASYAEAAQVLSLHVFAGIFVGMGIARGRWLIANNLQVYSFLYTGIGLIVNIAANYILISSHGLIGAAVATLLSQFIVAIVAPVFFKPTRVSSVMLIKSLNPMLWIKSLKILLER